MRPKYARVITNVFDGSAEYEIYGVDIPLTRETTDEYRLYADHENGCGGDKIVCFSLYTDGLITVEKIAWSASDHADVLSALNVRFAVKSTMSFMAWYWRDQSRKIATTQAKTTTLDDSITTPTDGYEKDKTATPTATPTEEKYEKLFYMDDGNTVAIVWSLLLDGLPLKAEKNGEYFGLRHYVDYEENNIAVVLTTPTKEHFVTTPLALFKLLAKLHLLNVFWGFVK